jgi:hypothetical protein
VSKKGKKRRTVDQRIADLGASGNGDGWRPEEQGDANESALYLDRQPGGASKSGLDEADAADLLGEEDAPLEYLPLLGKDGYVFKGWSNLLASYPRAGKTELLAACCRQWVERGETVLYLTEESRTIWRKRVRRLGSLARGVQLVFAFGHEPAKLLGRIRHCQQPVVVVDTLRNLGFLPEDENDNAAVARAVNPLIATCRAAGKTLEAAHHMRKGGGEHGEGIAGGHAIMGAFDAILELRRDAAQNRRVLKCYARLEQPEDLLYERGPEGKLYALGEAWSYERNEVMRRALKVLGGEWLKTAEVLELMGEPTPTNQTLTRALIDAAHAGSVERDPPIAGETVRGKPTRWRLKS